MYFLFIDFNCMNNVFDSNQWGFSVGTTIIQIRPWFIFYDRTEKLDVDFDMKHVMLQTSQSVKIAESMLCMGKKYNRVKICRLSWYVSVELLVVARGLIINLELKSNWDWRFEGQIYK